MFSSQSLRAVVRPGEILVREQRLGAAVRLLAVSGTLDASTAGELARRIDATPGGVRWLIVDLAAAVTVADEALAALVEAGRELRRCAGELIVAGGPRRHRAAPGGVRRRAASRAGGERRRGGHDARAAAVGARGPGLARRPTRGRAHAAPHRSGVVAALLP
jgi:hypothetical protein